MVRDFPILQHQGKNFKVSYIKAVKSLVNSTLIWWFVLEVKLIIIRNRSHDY